jgi:hypothetical protein
VTPTSLSSPSGRPRRGPEYQTRRRTERLAEVDRKRSGYLDLAAEGIIGRDELRAKLAALDETRAAAESELAAVRARAERLEEFEREAEAVLEVYAQLTPEALDTLAPEERQQFYRVLGLRVTAHQDAPPRDRRHLRRGLRLARSGGSVS